MDETKLARVLIIDDDPIAQAVVQDGLKSCGYSEFMLASDGSEGMRLYKESATEIGLVVTDILMPDSDGIEFVSFLATFEERCPVIICSGASDALVKSTPLLGSTLGVEILGRLRKPLSLDSLKSMLMRHDDTQLETVSSR